MSRSSALVGPSGAALSPAELMAGVVELLDAGTEYYTAVQTIIPVAASSEVIFTRFYNVPGPAGR